VSRARVSVAELAAESGRSPEDAAMALAEAGIKISGIEDVVPKSKAAAARRALGLERPRHKSARAAKSLRVARRRAAASARHVVGTATVIGARRPVPRPKLETPTPVSDTPSESPKRERKPRASKKSREFRWVEIGPAEQMRFLGEKEIEAIHWAIVEDFARDRDPIDPPGVKSEALLGSAAFRPQTSLGGIPKYPSVAMAGAALFHAIVHNHAFHNGNKRTALVSLISFLDSNGWILMADQDELFEYMVRLGSHGILENYDETDPLVTDKETQAVARWLQGHVRRVQKGEQLMQFRLLKRILTEFGCVFEKQTGNRMNIRRDKLKTQIFYSNDGMDVEQNSIHKIRKDLELDEEHDYDSEIFYRTQERIPGFIAKYRRILERLAEYDRQEERKVEGAPSS
jgi:death-on-curing family protein